MRPIPEKLKQEMADDKYYETCCIAFIGNCSGRIEWHHNLIFGGSQVNEKFCILPTCQAHHKIADRKDIKDMLNWVMLNRATDDELLPFCKVINYTRKKEVLNSVHGFPASLASHKSL